LPDRVLGKSPYDSTVRDAVIDRLIEDKMNVPQLLEAMRRDFCLDLSEGYVYNCLRDRVAGLDCAEYRVWVLEHFSGTLCVDEIHLGRYTLLLATDPINDFAVAFALVSANDKDHMRRFLGNLKRWGMEPSVVITDRSNLYPKVLAELWPDCQHQLCIFHVMQDINDCVVKAVRRFRRKLSNRGKGGRKAKRGRKPRHKANRKRSPTCKEKASFVYKHRYLIVKRRSEWSETEKKDYIKMCEYLPELRTLREYVDDVHQMFSLEQTTEGAKKIRRRLRRRKSYQAIDELVEATKMLDAKSFAKMIAFMKNPASRRLRTNNHVERTNRKLRYCEKVRYKWRRRRNIVRFLLLSLDHWRQHHPLGNASASTAASKEISPPKKSNPSSTRKKTGTAA
jgi:transposase-like protein